MENLLNKKTLLSVTVEEFIEALKEGLGLAIRQDDNSCNNVRVSKHYVYGLAGLEQLLGVSHSTAQRIKSSGVLDPATSQTGRILVFDADLVIDLLKVNNKKKYGNYKFSRTK